MNLKQVLPNDGPVRCLVEKLDAYQTELYGKPACNLESPESLIRNNAYMVGGFIEEELAGIGAVKIVAEYAEIKRMYVEEKFRGLGIAGGILKTLEAFAEGKGIRRIFLETGNRQDAAIDFYRKHGFKEVRSFGDYRPNEVSLYFVKEIQPVSA